MSDSEETYHMIIRTINSDNLPDVQHYVGSLHKKGFFSNLIKEGRFTVEEIKKLPIGRSCEIFFRKNNQEIQNGDIRIFKDTGDYSIHMDSGN